VSQVGDIAWSARASLAGPFQEDRIPHARASLLVLDEPAQVEGIGHPNALSEINVGRSELQGNPAKGRKAIGVRRGLKKDRFKGEKRWAGPTPRRSGGLRPRRRADSDLASHTLRSRTLRAGGDYLSWNWAWIGKELLGLLRNHSAIFAITAQEWMPSPRELWDKYGAEILTGPAAYVRLLGERKRIESITKTWEKLVLDRTEETRGLISVIRKILESTVVNVMVNNHFGGYAVASIELLERLWDETPTSS